MSPQESCLILVSIVKNEANKSLRQGLHYQLELGSWSQALRAYESWTTNLRQWKIVTWNWKIYESIVMIDLRILSRM
jgi:hypothetical protein